MSKVPPTQSTHAPSVPPDPGGDHSKAEYDALYREIADNSSRLYTVVSVCVTATTAFLGYFLKQVADKQAATAVLEHGASGGAVKDISDPLPFIFLIVVFLVIFPCMLLVESSAHSTVRIAGYLAVFYEGPVNVMWQSRLQTFRLHKEEEQKKNHNGAGGRRFGVGLRSIFDGLSAAVLICAFWSAWQLWPRSWASLTGWVFAALCVLFTVFHLRLHLRLKRSWSNEKFSQMQLDWRVIADLETQRGSAAGS